MLINLTSFKPTTLSLSLGLSLAAMTPVASADRATSTVETALTPKVTVVAARERDIDQSLVVTGTLVPRDEILVTPELDGQRITAVLVEEGAQVRQGQALARLSHELIDRLLDQQNALVDKATAAIPQAESSITQAQAELQEATLAYNRAQQLVQSGTTTAVVMETRTTTLQQAQSKVAYARSGLEVAKADLEQAKGVRDELQLRLARTEIRAPEDGIVSRRTARVGMIASASGEPLFRIIARGEIELDGEVLETKLPLLRQGAPAWVSLGEGDYVRGSVRAVYPEVDKATRLGKVRVRLDPDPRLRIGTFARGEVELAHTRGIVVPQAAVLYESGKRQMSSVLVVVDGKVAKRDVRIGLNDEDDVAIESGLAPGESVVARAGSFLRDGDRVRPIAETQPSDAPVSIQKTAQATAP